MRGLLNAYSLNKDYNIFTICLETLYYAFISFKKKCITINCNIYLYAKCFMLSFSLKTSIPISSNSSMHSSRNGAVRTLPTPLTSPNLNNCTQLKKIRGIFDLVKLTHLDIQVFYQVEELSGLEKLISLEEWQASSCYRLKKNTGFGAVHKSLKTKF